MHSAFGSFTIRRRDWVRFLVVLSVALPLVILAATARVPQAGLLVAATDGGCGGEADRAQIRTLQAAWWWFWVALGRGPKDVATDQHRIVIDTYTSSLTLFEHDAVVKKYPVAVGKGETPTPPGEWRVTNKSMNWGGGFGTRWHGLNVPWGIYGIHGTNQPHAIGQHVSGGCIRMFNEDVEELYDTIAVGTPVTIYGPLPRVAPRPAISSGAGKFMLVFQIRLRQAGFDPGPIDGQFGPLTGHTIREIHAFYGLPPTAELSRDGQRLIFFPE